MTESKKYIFACLRYIKKSNINISYCDLWNKGHLTYVGSLMVTFVSIFVFEFVIRDFMKKFNT